MYELRSTVFTNAQYSFERYAIYLKKKTLIIRLLFSSFISFLNNGSAYSTRQLKRKLGIFGCSSSFGEEDKREPAPSGSTS